MNDLGRRFEVGPARPPRDRGIDTDGRRLASRPAARCHLAHGPPRLSERRGRRGSAIADPHPDESRSADEPDRRLSGPQRDRLGAGRPGGGPGPQPPARPGGLRRHAAPPARGSARPSAPSTTSSSATSATGPKDRSAHDAYLAEQKAREAAIRRAAAAEARRAIRESTAPTCSEAEFARARARFPREAVGSTGTPARSIRTT